MHPHRSCTLSTETKQYSCSSFYVHVCVTVCTHDASENNLKLFKFKHIVVYKKGSDELDIRNSLIKVKVNVEMFLHSQSVGTPQIGYKVVIRFVCSSDNNIQTFISIIMLEYLYQSLFLSIV